MDRSHSNQRAGCILACCAILILVSHTTASERPSRPESSAFPSSEAPSGDRIIAKSRISTPKFHLRLHSDPAELGPWVLRHQSSVPTPHTVWTAHDARKPQLLFEDSAFWTWRPGDSSSLRVRWSGEYVFVRPEASQRGSPVQAIAMMFFSSDDALAFGRLLANDTVQYHVTRSGGRTLHVWDHSQWLRYIVVGPLFLRANLQETRIGRSSRHDHKALIGRLLAIADRK